AASLVENGAGTVVTVATDMIVTGRPAQFGRGLIEDVGGKIISQFADCLSRSLGPQEAPAPVVESPDSPPLQASPPPGPSQPVVAQPVVAQPAPSPPGRVPETREPPPSVLPVPPPMPPPMLEEIDLLEAAGGAVAKRAIPALTALVVLVLLIRWLRSRRQRAGSVVNSRPPTSTPAGNVGVVEFTTRTPPTALVDLGDGGA
ncbi:MAG TPA: hypothetical protein VE155_06180, partial [Pseudonocardiaceae bacterium]|nr:hypothetical protein [Pseudonocardiaceae bacterium]